MSQQGQAPMRELAQRVFAAEFNDATHTFRESDDDRAPVYALLPTGAKANRVFIVGTLTETDDVGDETEYWQGRIVDPTGTVFSYAGQYQPEAAGMLRETEPPAFVALVGKPRTYETDEGEINVSLRPEHLTVVDERTRNRWVTETAMRTLERIRRFDDAVNEYAQLAQDQYGGGVETYRQAVITAVESLDNTPEPTPPASSGAQTESGPTTGDEESERGGVTGADSSGTRTETVGEDETADSGDEIGDFDAGEFDTER